MILVALDPGLNRSGIAVFKNGLLTRAGTQSAPREGNELARALVMARRLGNWFRLEAEGSIIDRFVAEVPQVYARGAGRTKGDPNDLIPLALVVGATAQNFSFTGLEPEIVKPAEWKGQIPKAVKGAEYIVKRRALAALSPDERNALPPTLHHDGWDAIGIGLHALGRWAQRVFPGAT